MRSELAGTDQESERLAKSVNPVLGYSQEGKFCVADCKKTKK